jgi:diguanylate cyclase (GGDEF)-like protein
MKNIKHISKDSAMRSVFIYFLGIFLLIGAVLTGTISVLYNLETEDYLSRIELEEQHNLKLQIAALRSGLEVVITDLLFLSKQNELLDMLDTRDSSLREQIAREYLQFSRHKKLYDQIRFLDETGLEIVRVNYNGGSPNIVPGSRLQSKGDRYYFRDTYALENSEVFISPFDLNIENGKIEIPFKPMIRFGVPVYDRHKRKRGVIILNYLGASILSKIKEIAKLSPGNIMLVNGEGYWLSNPNPTNEWGFMIEDRKDRQFGSAFPDVWNRIAKSAADQVHNEKGLFTASTVYPISEGLKSSSGSSDAFGSSDRTLDSDEYYWKVISHIPEDALHKETKGLLTKLFFLAVTLFLVSAIPSWFIAQAIVRHRFHQIELFHTANHDKLTDLPNRSLFLDRLGQILKESERYGRKFALLFIDLDGFKTVNDTYGHDAGDVLLIQTAERLTDCTRKSDTVARLGGDEFTVIVSEIKVPEDVEVVAQHILTALSTPFSIKNHSVTIGGSIGMSVFPDNGEDGDDLLRNADAAMYQAKMGGKNGYRFSTE